MKLLDLLEYDTGLRISKHLNPAIWKDEKLKDEVRKALTKIAKAFIDTLDIDQSAIADIIFTGSNVNYNWSKFSDIDLHIAVTDECEGCNIEDDSCIQAKKTLWNLQHEMKIKKIPVEMYVHNAEQNITLDAAAYSLLRNEWIQKPDKKITNIKIQEDQIVIKAEALEKEINNAVDTGTTVETLEALADKIWRMRQAGISSGGEFSIENLTFKALRNNGTIDKLRKAIRRAQDKQLSLE